MVAVALAGMIALAGLVLGRIYADPLLAELVAGAAIGSVGVRAATRRLPSWTVAPMSVAAAGRVHRLRRATGREPGRRSPTRCRTCSRDALGNGIPRLLTAHDPGGADAGHGGGPGDRGLAGRAGRRRDRGAGRPGAARAARRPPRSTRARSTWSVRTPAPPGWPTLIFAGLVAVAALAVSARPADAGTVRRGAGDSPGGRARASLAGAAAGLVVVLGLVVAVGPWVGDRVGGHAGRSAPVRAAAAGGQPGREPAQPDLRLGAQPRPAAAARSGRSRPAPGRRRSGCGWRCCPTTTG